MQQARMRVMPRLHNPQAVEAVEAAEAAKQPLPSSQ